MLVSVCIRLKKGCLAEEMGATSPEGRPQPAEGSVGHRLANGMVQFTGTCEVSPGPSRLGKSWGFISAETSNARVLPN